MVHGSHESIIFMLKVFELMVIALVIQVDWQTSS